MFADFIFALCLAFREDSCRKGLGLWGLMSLSRIFSYIVALSFIGGWNRSTRRKLPTCPVTDKLYHMMLNRVHTNMSCRKDKKKLYVYILI